MTVNDCTLTEPQLFLDDLWIADSGRLQRVWHQAEKYPDPVLTAEHPWEYNCPVVYGSVLRVDGKFRMWYCGWTRGLAPRVCYAESADGIHWLKPALGLCEVGGSSDNNVVLQSLDPDQLIDDVTVIHVPEDADRPWHMLFWDRAERGIHLARSADGLAWERQGRVLPEWGDRFNALSGRIDGKYLLLGREPEPWRFGKGRVVSRVVSDDLVNWSEPQLVITADHEDPSNMEIYSATAFTYGDLLLGSLERMYRAPDKLDTELIWSRDAGLSWSRSRPRPSLIPWGPPPRWDDTWVNLPASGPIPIEGQLWLYYSGRSGAHGAQFPRNHGGIGLAFLRQDGFCSLQATEQEGWLLTPSFTWPGGDLAVNIDCRRNILGHPRNVMTGDLSVDVLAADGSEREDWQGELQQANDRCLRIAWGNDRRSLAELRGQDLKLRFRLRDAHLYAFKAIPPA